MRPWKSAPGGREPRRRAPGPAKPPPHKTWEPQVGTCSSGTSLEDRLHPLSMPCQAVATAHPKACTDLSGSTAAGPEATVSAPTPPPNPSLHPHCPGKEPSLHLRLGVQWATGSLGVACLPPNTPRTRRAGLSQIRSLLVRGFVQCGALCQGLGV